MIFPFYCWLSYQITFFMKRRKSPRTTCLWLSGNLQKCREFSIYKCVHKQRKLVWSVFCSEIRNINESDWNRRVRAGTVEYSPVESILSRALLWKIDKKWANLGWNHLAPHRKFSGSSKSTIKNRRKINTPLTFPSDKNNHLRPWHPVEYPESKRYKSNRDGENILILNGKAVEPLSSVFAACDFPLLIFKMKVTNFPTHLLHWKQK